MNGPAPIALAAAPEADFAEIAAALGVSKQAASKRASTGKWPFKEVPHPGGAKRYFPLVTLPPDVREKVQLARLHQHAASLPIPVTPAPIAAAPVTPVPTARVALQVAGDLVPDLTRHQLDVERARDRLLAFVAEFPGSIGRAIDHLNAERYAGRLPLPLVWAFDHAWDKPRASNRLTVKTYHNWRQAKATRGRAAPKKIQPDMEVKPWYGLLLALRQRPQGGCYTWIHGQIVAQWDRGWGDDIPGYDAVRRVCIEKISAIAQLKGRLTGSALRQHKHWHPRSGADLQPWQEVHADGWNTHFTAPHPKTGEFVTYEVWHFHDASTRYVPPPGIGLTETYEVITAGVERCVRAGGIMAILQTDSTKVVKRSPRFTADPWAALSERAGFTVVHPKEVGNSQANGICENFNTWLDKQSRELATYQGKGMDSLTLKRVKKLTEKMVKASNAGDLVERDRLQKEAERMGKGRVFTSLEEATAWIEEKCERWNDKPHRSLPKIADPITGKKRHQTPREALQRHIDAGWKPVALTEDHLVDLFRPHVVCKVTREAVSPVGNGQRYHFPGLGAWNGQEVMVAIDPMEWRAVWIKTLDGEFIGVADLVQTTGYRAKSQYEIAEEKRAGQQLKRLSLKADRIKARTNLTIAAPTSAQIVIGGRVIDAAALAAIEAPAEGRNDAPSRAAQTLPPLSRSERSIEDNYAEWLDIGERITHGDTVSDLDRKFYERWPDSSQGRVYFKRVAGGGR